MNLVAQAHIEGKNSVRQKFLLIRNDSGVWGEDCDDLADGVPVVRSTEVALDGAWILSDPARRVLTMAEHRKAALRAGDLVVTTSSGSRHHIGKTALADEVVEGLGCAFSNFMQRLRPGSNADSRFLFYVLNSPLGREQMSYLGSTTTGLINLNGQVLGNLVFPKLPLLTQRAIADYLDRKTAAIDAVIEKKERLLALLAEKRASLIHQAVTKGLDGAAGGPTVPMKDSGIPWIGEIPAHWGVTELRRSWTVVDCKHRTPTYVESGYPVISTTEVKPGELDLAVVSRFIEEEDFLDMTEGGRRPRRGDIVYSRNASLGAAAYVDTAADFAMGQDVVLIRSDANDQLFLSHFLNSSSGLTQVDLACVGSTFKRINVGQIRALTVCVPPPAEQTAIASYLEDILGGLAQVEKAVGIQITRLQEYRQSIITAAVTGQLDIPEVAA